METDSLISSSRSAIGSWSSDIGSVISRVRPTSSMNTASSYCKVGSFVFIAFSRYMRRVLA